MFIIVFSGFIRIFRGFTDNFEKPFAGTEKSLGHLALAFYGGLWPYEAWNGLNYLTEEIINPKKTMKDAIMISMPCIIVIYLLVNIAYFTVLSPGALKLETAVALAYAKNAIGPAVHVVPYLVCLSAMGSFNGGLLTQTRLSYVAARDGNMPLWMCFLSKNKTPVVSIVFYATVTSLCLLPDTTDFDHLLEIFGFSQWAVYATTFAALLYLRKIQPEKERPFKVWTIVPVIATIIGYGIVVIPLVMHPKSQYFLVLGMVTVSVLLYYLVGKNSIGFVDRLNDRIAYTLKERLGLIEPMLDACQDNVGMEMGLSTYERFD